ncbi:MAG TPA: hypothetical protein VHE55_17685 [Fimbriimonadaceae bacterium]|nr:hypothetical protein [Fimbriimonadaceae bacterium]
MKRLFATGAILGFAVAAFALGSFFKVVQDTYKFPADSPAAKAKCMLCHVSKMGGAKLNAYGMDVKKALNGSKTITPKILHSIDHLKSGKHAETNGELLKAGKLPG